MPKLNKGEMQIAFNDPISKITTLIKYRELHDVERKYINDVIKKKGYDEADKILLNEDFIRKRVDDLTDKDGKKIDSVVDKDNNIVYVFEYYKIISTEKRESKNATNR